MNLQWTQFSNLLVWNNHRLFDMILRKLINQQEFHTVEPENDVVA